LISWQGVNHRPESLARVRRPENRSSWSSHAGERNPDRRMKKQAVDVEGIDLFLDPTIVLGRSESRGSALDQPRVRAHPEPLNHPILISRTVRRTYPTYMPSFHMSSSPYFWQGGG